MSPEDEPTTLPTETVEPEQVREEPQPTPRNNDEHESGITSRLDRLDSLVSTLAETVAKLIPDTPVVKRDIPWTHRGGRK